MADPEANTPGARARALAVLRVRGTAQAVALLPAAVAVVLIAGGATGHIGGSGAGWRMARWVAVGVAALALVVAAGVTAVIARARPALSPTVPIAEARAPDLYRLVRDLADQLDVPPPSAIALTPDCDSWLEDRTHRAQRPRRARARAGADGSAQGGGRERRTPTAPVLVIGSPFLWWMRVAELRALLAPVVAGTGPAAHPDIAAARRFVRGLDAAAAVAARGNHPMADTFTDTFTDTCPYPDTDTHTDSPTGAPTDAGPYPASYPASYPGADADQEPDADPGWAAGASPAAGPREAEPARAPYAEEPAPAPYATAPSDPYAVGEAEPPHRTDGGVADGGPGPDGGARLRAPGRPGPLAALGRAVRRPGLAFVGWVARMLLRACRDHAAEMERGVAAAASQRAQGVDYGLRIVAQEQVGLAYAGWDRLLTRVALPAWRMGRWPSRLDAGVVAALTELSRRDRLAEGFASRLGERPACDLLEEPGAIDEATSLLAARLFHGGPSAPGPDWSPVDWGQYPEEVVDRKWRTEAARLHTALDTLPRRVASPAPYDPVSPAHPLLPGTGPSAAPGLASDVPDLGAEPTLDRVLDRLSVPGGADGDPEGMAERLAARLTSALAREEAAQRQTAASDGMAAGPAAAGPGTGGAGEPWLDGIVPLFPLQPPRTGRELLADHVTAMICCAAVDTAGAAPGLDWLDGPVLLVDGRRRTDLAAPVLSLIEDGDPDPLRTWLGDVGVRPDKPIRLV
ncbi:hypothetical protein [Streptomyces zagrosensis]|uniref:Uncharacterized protein n=1 Tax=Streptomyces zagrosensis TaxID=1042984 RepID=A0A7W9Q552_9ACTN|nr:hypothetical protein [Streptomyces zagrosensis]MBB5933815.1 hypothetical protein [Streptomyces zagrosensis]